MFEKSKLYKAIVADDIEAARAILKRKPLREYGVTKADIDAFTDNVMTKQGRLTANNYVPLDAAAVKAIYESLY